MKIGIIGPSEDEIIPFIEQIKNKVIIKQALLTFYQGTYKNIDVIALYCGVGKVNAAIAAQLLIDKFAVSHIFVVGVAGAISDKLKIGDTVIATKTAYHDVAKEILTEYHPWMESIYFMGDNQLLKLAVQAVKHNILPQNVYFGKIVTGECFIENDGREAIIDKFAPECVDMESASIAHVCYVNAIPFMAIRSISDTPNNSGIEVFENNCVKAAKASIEVLQVILNNW